jgi:hypothetical protein
MNRRNYKKKMKRMKENFSKKKIFLFKNNKRMQINRKKTKRKLRKLKIKNNRKNRRKN